MLQFNKEQIEVINHTKGPLMVVASAGSGKSTVLVERITNLVRNHNVKEEEIITITFTKKSADDLNKKLLKKGLTNVNCGTFHSICGRILHNEGYNVYSQTPLFEIKKAFARVEKNPDVEDILSFISYQKCYLKGPKDAFVPKSSGYSDIQLANFYEIYEDLKYQKKTFDFDDWLLEALKILKESNGNKYKAKYLLVDEHQDSNLIQNMLIKELCSSENICVVGDYRQCIYSFRGSNPKLFMDFYKNYQNTKVVNLDINYRSNSTIVNMSNDFIRNFYKDYEKYSDSKPNNMEKVEVEHEIFLDKVDQADIVAQKIYNLITLKGVNPNDIAILYRNNNNSFEMQIELTSRGIPCYIESDASFFKSKQIIPIIAMLRLIENYEDDEAFDMLFRSRVHPMTFVSKKTYGELEQFAAINFCSYYEATTQVSYSNSGQKMAMENLREIVTALSNQRHFVSLEDLIDRIIKILKMEEYINSNFTNQEEKQNRLQSLDTFKKFIKNNTLKSFLSFINDSNKYNKKKDEDAVQLMTIHKSKGLEFDYVFIIGVEDKKFPSIDTDIVDEANLFYVSVTRTKKFLYIGQIGNYNSFTQLYFKQLM